MLAIQTARCSVVTVRANSLTNYGPWSLLLRWLLSQIGPSPSRSVQARQRRKCSRFVARLWVVIGAMLTDSCVTETSGYQRAQVEGVCGSGGVYPLILKLPKRRVINVHKSKAYAEVAVYIHSFLSYRNVGLSTCTSRRRMRKWRCISTHS